MTLRVPLRDVPVGAILGRATDITGGVQLAYTAMKSEQISLDTWEPSAEQLQAAQYRASGYSAARTAEVCNLGLRTVQRYDSEPAYAALVMQLRTEMMRGLEPKLAALMDAASEVLIAAMKGELAGDDARVQLARDISRDTSFRLLRARVAERIQRGQYLPAPGS